MFEQKTGKKLASLWLTLSGLALLGRELNFIIFKPPLFEGSLLFAPESNPNSYRLESITKIYNAWMEESARVYTDEQKSAPGRVWVSRTVRWETRPRDKEHGAQRPGRQAVHLPTPGLNTVS